MTCTKHRIQSEFKYCLDYSRPVIKALRTCFTSCKGETKENRIGQSRENRKLDTIKPSKNYTEETRIQRELCRGDKRLHRTPQRRYQRKIQRRDHRILTEVQRRDLNTQRESLTTNRRNWRVASQRSGHQRVYRGPQRRNQIVTEETIPLRRY